jgi:hypothetical protein
MISEEQDIYTHKLKQFKAAYKAPKLRNMSHLQSTTQRLAILSSKGLYETNKARGHSKPDAFDPILLEATQKRGDKMTPILKDSVRTMISGGQKARNNAR